MFNSHHHVASGWNAASAKRTIPLRISGYGCIEQEFYQMKAFFLIVPVFCRFYRSPYLQVDFLRTTTSCRVNVPSDHIAVVDCRLCRIQYEHCPPDSILVFTPFSFVSKVTDANTCRRRLRHWSCEFVSFVPLRSHRSMPPMWRINQAGIWPTLFSTRSFLHLFSYISMNIKISWSFVGLLDVGIMPVVNWLRSAILLDSALTFIFTAFY